MMIDSFVRGTQIALLTVASLVATTGVARAEPTQYLQVDAMIGGSSPVDGPNLLGAVEGGYRLTSQLWAHGEIAGGPAGDDQGSGTNTQLRGGIEARSCTESNGACVLFGLDLGGFRGTWASQDATSTEHVVALMAVPRFGVDLGGSHLRGRAAIELDEAIAGHHMTSFAPTTTTSGTLGAELVVGIAYQW